MSDNRELAHASDGALPARNVSSAAGLIAMVADAARDPSIDADKMVTLANLATSLQDREREAEFNRDKIAAIMEMPSISKRGEIIIPAKDNRPARIQGRYAKFEDMHRAVMPILARHRMVLTFNVDHQGQMVSVQPILSHANGYVEKGGVMLLPIDTSGSKNATQGAGSAASYGKRQQLKAVLNIIEDGEDIDGLGSLPDDQLNDRQERMLEEARAAAAKAPEQYAEWFGKQRPQDRAWLVVSGRHAELGGAEALPPPQAKQEPEPEPEPEQSKAEPGEDAELRRHIDAYKLALKGKGTLAAMAAYQKKNQAWTKWLSEEHPDAFQEITAANSERFQELSAAGDDAGELFSGDA